MDLEKAEVLAWDLLKEHDLNSWHFKFDRAKLRFGKCDFRKKEISISKHLTALNDEDVVQNTLLHEIAHALAGHKAGHGAKWKTITIEIGGTPERCFSNTKVKLPNMKFTAKCGTCSKEFQASRKRKIACKACCQNFNNGKYSAKFEIIFTEN